MTLRFRKSIAVMPGVRLNLGKRGLSVRIGTRGFGHTIGTSGRRTTIGLPGSGVSFTKVHRRVPQGVAARSYDAPAAPDTRQEQHHAGNQKAEIKPGRDRRESTPIGSKVRYAQNRHRPVGQWVQTTLAESVVGVHHRKPMAIAFARAAREAEAKGLIYGVELEHRPDNPHDPNAIAVIGIAERKGWFKRTVDRWHIGYLDREIAAEIVSDLVAQGIPVAAELYSIYEGVDSYLDFKVIVLAPPGNSTKARQRKAGQA